MRVWLLLLLFALLVGCGAGKPHVAIAAPPPNLTPDQRAYAFEQLRPVGSEVEATRPCGRTACGGARGTALILSSGHKIWNAEDLLPVLPVGSPAAVAARAIPVARRKGNWTSGAGALVLLTAAVVAIGGYSEDDDARLYIGLGGAAAGLGLIGMASSYRWEVSSKTAFVFQSYEHNLATRLRMCVNGLRFVPCEQNVPGNVMPDPALQELRQQ